MDLQDIGPWLTTHAGALHAVHDRLCFQRLCNFALRELIGHQAVLAVIGKVANNRVSILSAINCGFPDALVG